MVKLKKLIENEYGSKNMKLQGLWICLFFGIQILFTTWLIKNSIHGNIFNFILKYIRIFTLSIGVSIFFSTLFSYGMDNKFIKYLLTILVGLSLAMSAILILPIGLLLKTNQFFEMLSRFKINLTKLLIYTVSLTLSFLVISIYLGASIALYPIFDQSFDGSYIFILVLMILFILSFNTLNKWTYKLLIYTAKSYHSKRQLLQSYFQDFKEKNIIMLLLFFIATLYLYSQKSNNTIIQASAASITTIVLLDALIDKWKNRFHKNDFEYRLIELLNIDLQVIIGQIIYCKYSNINIKLITNNHLELMETISTTTGNKSFRKIIAIYKNLSMEYHPYESFIKHLYELETRIINYIIQCN